MTLSEKIYTCRRKQGLSQETLAEQLSVSRQAVSKWETGDAEPESGKLIALAQTFHVTVDWLLNGDDPSPEEPSIHMIQTASAAAPTQKGFQNLRLGYLVYLGCLFLFLIFAMSARVFFYPTVSWHINFAALIDFFDPVILCAMLIGCILLLYGSKSLPEIVQAFRFMVCKRDHESCSSAQAVRYCRAVRIALVGWMLGGMLSTLTYIIHFIKSMDLSSAAVGAVGSVIAVPLNFLLYMILAWFVLLPVEFSLKQKTV